MKRATRCLRLSMLFAACFAVNAPWAAQVDLLGAPDGIREDLRATSLTLAAEKDGVTDPGELIAAARADYARLIGKLYEFGYFGPSLRISVDGQEAAGVSVLSPPAQVRRITITIVPGPQFTFGTAKVTPQAPETPLPEAFMPGATATTPAMRAAVEQQILGWRHAGHAKAALSGQVIRANHPAREIDASVTLAPGPRLTFGDMHIARPSAVRDTRLRAIAGLRPGDVYSPAEIETAEQRLRETGAFTSAVISEADSIGPGDTLTTIIEVTDAKPRRFGFGAEVSSTEGGSVSAFWMHRNIGGAADRLRFDAEIGGIGSSEDPDLTLGLAYARPATFTRNTLARIDARLERLHEPNYASDQLEATVTFERVVSDRLKPKLAFGLRFDETTQEGVSTTFRHAYLSLGVTWDRRDDTLHPTSGTYAEAEVAPYIGLDGSSGFTRVTADLRGYRALGDQMVFATRAQLGLVSDGSSTSTPADLLFYSGGGGTVRGHGYQSLGVVSGTGTTGGLGFLGLSAEMRYQLRDAIGLVGFVDAGLVSADAGFSDTGTHAGAGIGLRYFTPIGPIRLDVATPISGEGDGFGIYVGIGQAF